MKSHWRKLAALLPPFLEKAVYRNYFFRQHKRWRAEGDGGAVSHYSKQKLIEKTAADHGLHTLIETGTYLGDMVFAMQDRFDTIISIELSERFYQKAVRRFKGFKQVTLLQGDSGLVLQQTVPQLSGAALFWLDGHYSGGLTAKGEKECPVYEELAAILASSYPHVLLIDDARLFVGKNDYPTLEELTAFIHRYRPKATVHLENDAIIVKLR